MHFLRICAHVDSILRYFKMFKSCCREKFYSEENGWQPRDVLPQQIRKAGDEEGDNSDKQDGQSQMMLNINSAYEHLDFSSSTNKSTCTICKTKLDCKNPTSLG